MATATIMTRPPLPPFSRETAVQEVRLAEDRWNSRDPGKVALAYAIDSRWRNRSEFINGRNEIIAFLTRKWVRELDYRLIKELWTFAGNRIAVRFAYEWHDAPIAACRNSPILFTTRRSMSPAADASAYIEKRLI